MLNMEQFLTVICAPYFFAHAQLLNSELNVGIIVDSQIWFTILYFRITISFFILVGYGHFDHFDFIQSLVHWHGLLQKLGKLLEWVSLNRKSGSSEKCKGFAFYFFGRNIYELGGDTCEDYQVK